MKTIRFILSALMAGTAAAATVPMLPLVPMPASVVTGPGSLMLRTGAGIAIPAGDAGAASVAKILAERVKVDRGLTLVPGAAGPVRLVRDAGVAAPDAYVLTVTTSGATVAASGDAGLLYGAMTLVQLLSPDSAFGRPVAVPAMVVRDAPRFRWRGLMIDVTRHFQPISSLYTIVDALAEHKMNVLHLHLTDDQGWRVEIKRYPKLTAIGGFRTPPSSGGAPGPKVGGFYTQAELKALVAYAAARSVTIVPEIDLPGHAQAAVAAYPEVGVFGDRPAVSHDWGVNPYLFSPTDRSMGFIRNVLDELVEIFPSTFIHVGGDEAIKDQWQRSLEVQAKMKALGITTENGMQSWMIEQLGTYLASKGRRLIGWDEILEGGLPPSASVMSWRGDKGAIAAADAGHDVVMSPAPTLYLDSLQSDHGDEAPGRLSIQTLADVYRYEPVPAGLSADRMQHVLGAQGNAWSEYLVTPEQIQHAVFPRLDAIAEMTWSPEATRNFDGFLARLQPQRARYRRAGIAAADGAFAVEYRMVGSRGDALRSGRVGVMLGTQASYGTIRYTLDGAAPTLRSAEYHGPVRVAPGVTIRAAAFDAAGSPTAATRSFDSGRMALLRRTTSELTACAPGTLGLRVPQSSEATANAPAFNVNIFDTCSIYPAAPLDVAGGFTIDVARLPRNYGLAHDEGKVKGYYSVTPHGELTIRAGGCDGAVVATYPMPDPAASPARFTLTGSLPPGKGDSDLCMTFTTPRTDPYYAVAAVQLVERAR